MADLTQEATTFERSCRHWSEASADEMSAFYRLASHDYTLLAEHRDWGAELARLSEATSRESLSLLDVACGSGKFPAALLANEAFRRYSGKPIDYHLLDPSEFSLREAATQLRPPLRRGRSHHCTLQELRPESPHDVVWATHALYCVPAEELPTAAERFCSAMRPGGWGFIAHATADSHYLRFQRLYLRHHPGASGAPFCTADEVSVALRERGERFFGDSWWWEDSIIDYEGTLPLRDTRTAEMYLQRCLFDDDLTLERMLENETLGEYLRTQQDDAKSAWRFSQQVRLMRFGGGANA